MDKLMTSLAALADKLNVGVDVLWAALLRQAMISGIADLLIYAALIVAVYWMIRWGRWCRTAKPSGYADIGERWFAFGIVCLPLAVAVIVAVFSFSTTAAAFLNPEYWVLNKIMGLLR